MAAHNHHIGVMDPKKVGVAERKEKAAIEGRKALAEYEANGVAMRKNMEKLRAMRLEKEAADRAAALAAPAPEAPAKKKTRAKPANKSVDKSAES